MRYELGWPSKFDMGGIPEDECCFVFVSDLLEDVSNYETDEELAEGLGEELLLRAVKPHIIVEISCFRMSRKFLRGLFWPLVLDRDKDFIHVIYGCMLTDYLILSNACRGKLSDVKDILEELYIEKSHLAYDEMSPILS